MIPEEDKNVYREIFEGQGINPNQSISEPSERPKGQKHMFNDGTGMISLNFGSTNIPRPTEQLSSGGKYPIIAWGIKKWPNMFPQYLVDARNKSATHNSILHLKYAQIAGKGWIIDDSADNDQRAAISEFMYRINADELLKKIAIDYATFGYFTIGVNWRVDRKGIAKLYHIDASTVRVEKILDGEFESKGFWVSKSWRLNNKELYQPERFDKFDFVNRVDAEQIMMVKNYSPDTQHYSLPDYCGCLNDIETEFRLSNSINSTLRNGMQNSCILSLNDGPMTDEKLNIIHQAINNVYKGDEMNGKYLLFTSKSKQNAPTVEPLNFQNLDQIYAQFSQAAKENIVSGHRLTSGVLAGISSPGKLGNSNGADIKMSQELFYSLVIKPMQNKIENTFNNLLKLNGFTIPVFIDSLQPVRYEFNEATLMSILSIDEMRRRIGMPPISQNDRQELAARNGQASVIVPEKPTAGAENKPTADSRETSQKIK